MRGKHFEREFLVCIAMLLAVSQVYVTFEWDDFSLLKDVNKTTQEKCIELGLLANIIHYNNKLTYDFSRFARSIGFIQSSHRAKVGPA